MVSVPQNLRYEYPKGVRRFLEKDPPEKAKEIMEKSRIAFPEDPFKFRDYCRYFLRQPPVPITPPF